MYIYIDYIKKKLIRIGILIILLICIIVIIIIIIIVIIKYLY